MPSTDKNQESTQGDEILRATIRQRLRDLRISAREASRRSGLNLGYVGDILEGRSKLPERERILRLAETLEFDPSDFVTDSPADSGRTNALAVLPIRERSGENIVMIPLYAAPLPVPVAFLKYADKPVGEVQALPSMGACYAVIVANDANAPRYFPGETIFMKPGTTPKVGDFVFVKMILDGMAAIGRLESIDPDSLSLRFCGLEGPDSTRQVPFAEVESVHWIMGVLH